MKMRIGLVGIFLTLFSLGGIFGEIKIDVNNPYLDFFVKYRSVNKENKVREGNLYGNFQEDNFWEKLNSSNPIGDTPTSLTFQIVVKREQDEIKLSKHNFNIFDILDESGKLEEVAIGKVKGKDLSLLPLSLFFYERVFEENFIVNEKMGEVIYKIRVIMTRYLNSKKDSISKADDSLEGSSSIEKESIDCDKRSKNWMKINALEIKILYAEFDGKEMRFDENTSRAIQEKCTLVQAMLQNCIYRCPGCDHCENWISGDYWNCYQNCWECMRTAKNLKRDLKSKSVKRPKM